MPFVSATSLLPPFDRTDWSSTEIQETNALLVRARALVARGWCRGALARNLLGWHVRPDSRRAIYWCANGALIAAAVTGSHSGQGHYLAASRLKGAIPDAEGIAAFNDRQKTVEPVLAAFDRAIALGDDSKAGEK